MGGNRCEHIKPDGAQCKVEWGVNPSTARCFCHDPERAERLKVARQKGQSQSAHIRRRSVNKTVRPDQAPAPPQTVADCALWGSWAIHACATGHIDGKTAHEITYGINALLRALEKGAVADDVAALRAEVERLKTEAEA
jgi:hypothetical protein